MPSATRSRREKHGSLIVYENVHLDSLTAALVVCEVRAGARRSVRASLTQIRDYPILGWLLQCVERLDNCVAVVVLVDIAGAGSRNPATHICKRPVAAGYAFSAMNEYSASPPIRARSLNCVWNSLRCSVAMNTGSGVAVGCGDGVGSGLEVAVGCGTGVAVGSGVGVGVG